jgi:hypothetical protein
MFALLSVLSDPNPTVDGTATFIYFGLAGLAVQRWGLLSLAVAVLVADLFLDIPATSDVSAWYFGSTMLLIGLVVALAAWTFYRRTAVEEGSVRVRDADERGSRGSRGGTRIARPSLPLGPPACTRCTIIRSWNGSQPTTDASIR